MRATWDIRNGNARIESKWQITKTCDLLSRGKFASQERRQRRNGLTKRMYFQGGDAVRKGWLTLIQAIRRRRGNDEHRKAGGKRREVRGLCVSGVGSQKGEEPFPKIKPTKLEGKTLKN